MTPNLMRAIARFLVEWADFFSDPFPDPLLGWYRCGGKWLDHLHGWRWTARVCQRLGPSVLAVLLICSPAWADGPYTEPPRKRAPKPAASPSPSPEPFDLGPPAPLSEPMPLGEGEPPPPAPTPSPSPDLLQRANARPLHIDTQLGALVTLTGDAGTDVTPTMWVNVDGPLAFGSRRSLGRLGARLGLSSSPGATTFDVADIRTYRAVEVGVWLGRVVGQLGDVSTTVVAEGTFASRLKGSTQPAPLDRLSRGAGLGLRFDARRSNASLTALVGYDEATASCAPTVVCTGVYSGLAVSLYGQVPIVQGAVLFIGDVVLSTGQRSAVVRRRDIERVGLVVDLVQTVKVVRGK